MTRYRDAVLVLGDSVDEALSATQVNGLLGGYTQRALALKAARGRRRGGMCCGRASCVRVRRIGAPTAA